MYTDWGVTHCICDNLICRFRKIPLYVNIHSVKLSAWAQAQLFRSSALHPESSRIFHCHLLIIYNESKNVFFIYLLSVQFFLQLSKLSLSSSCIHFLVHTSKEITLVRLFALWYWNHSILPFELSSTSNLPNTSFSYISCNGLDLLN